MRLPYHLPLLVEFSRRLGRADIPHLIGGSIASSLYGDYRLTNDVDLELQISGERVDGLVEVLGEPFSVSRGEIEDALRDPGPFASFQVLHTDEVFKFDCFLHGRAPFDAEAFARSQVYDFPPYGSLRFASAEHIFVQKLRWFDLGRRTSERQWRDLVGIARAAQTFDRTLATRWASSVDLADLAAETLAEADAREAE